MLVHNRIITVGICRSRNGVGFSHDFCTIYQSPTAARVIIGAAQRLKYAGRNNRGHYRNPQLDALLVGQAEAAAAGAPAAIIEEVKPGKEPVAVAATEDKSEPAPSPEGNAVLETDPGTEAVETATIEDKSEPAPSPTADQVVQKDPEPELATGSVAPTERAAEVSPAPAIEPLTEGADLP